MATSQMSWFRTMPVLVIMCIFGFAGVARSQENEALAKLQKAFDAKLNAELDRQAEKARTLRTGYLGALEKLKTTLGREDNLKGAAIVLKEIDAVTNGEEAKELPAGTDYRIRNLRKKWDRGLKDLHEDGNRSVRAIAERYFKVLEQEKRKYTRAGKIEEALAFETEVKRVKALPEIEAAIDSARSSEIQKTLRGAEPNGDVALLSKGAKAKADYTPTRMIDGNDDALMYASGDIPCEFVVELSEIYTLSSIKMRLYDNDSRKYTYTIEVSENGRQWEMVEDRSKKPSRGTQLHRFAEGRDVKFIKVKGLSNSLPENNQFHIVELEAR